MGNTCTSQMQTKQKKVIPSSNTQLSIETEHAEHTSDFNFQIQEPSLVASNYQYVLAQAVNNPQKLVRRTNVRACFKHPSSEKQIQDFRRTKQNLSTQSSDR